MRDIESTIDNRQTTVARTRIKVCGIKTVEHAVAAADAGADAVGLNFVRASPRFVDLATAAKVIAALPAFVEPVGLFADAPAEDVRAAAEGLRLRAVQLHGREGPGYASQLVGLRVVKAFAFEGARLRERVEPWRQSAGGLAAVLIDAPPPTVSAELRGGSGQTFDWAALASAVADGALAGLPPVILAGGLTADNVGEAVAAVRPYAVDVSSGVESSRGVKDAGKIAAFCAAVRAADGRRRR